jgi:hypothetical protein
MQKTFPSVKAIVGCGVDATVAMQIRRIMQTSSRSLVCADSSAAYEADKKSFNPHSLVYLKMVAIDQLLGTFGVEGSEGLEYCNAGDTYALTVVRHGGRFKVGSWGDIVERHNL